MSAKVNNAELIKNLINKAKININIDNVPSELAEKIIPVLEVSTPAQLIQIEAGTASDATFATIYTTSSNKNTYLVGAELTTSKDALATSIVSSISIVPFGKAGVSILTTRYEPTTAGHIHREIFFGNHPIKLAKNSEIRITNSTAIASIDSGGIAYFYEEDDN